MSRLPEDEFKEVIAEQKSTIEQLESYIHS